MPSRRQESIYVRNLRASENPCRNDSKTNCPYCVRPILYQSNFLRGPTFDHCVLDDLLVKWGLVKSYLCGSVLPCIYSLLSLSRSSATTPTGRSIDPNRANFCLKTSIRISVLTSSSLSVGSRKANSRPTNRTMKAKTAKWVFTTEPKILKRQIPSSKLFLPLVSYEIVFKRVNCW